MPTPNLEGKNIPTLEIVAGPNGSGKSSFAQTFFGKKRNRTNFINADIIATGLAPGREELAAFRAGRVVLASVKDTIGKGHNIAFESTLSGKTWLPLVRKAKQNQYHVTIYFLFLRDVRLNLKRIERRVRMGGHSGPADAVKRRYPRSFNNFWKQYRLLCDNWFVFDNTATKPTLVLDRNTWERLSDEDKQEFEMSFLKKGTLKNGKN